MAMFEPPKNGKRTKKRAHHGHKLKLAICEPSTATTSTATTMTTMTNTDNVAEPEDEIEREVGVVAVCPEGRQVLVDMLARRRERAAEKASEETSRQTQERKMELELDANKKRVDALMDKTKPAFPLTFFPTDAVRVWVPSPPHANERPMTLQVPRYSEWRNNVTTSTPKEEPSLPSPMSPMSPNKGGGQFASLSNALKKGWSLLDEKTAELLDEKTAEWIKAQVNADVESLDVKPDVKSLDLKPEVGSLDVKPDVGSLDEKPEADSLDEKPLMIVDASEE